MASEMLLEVETVDGLIPLEGGSGSRNADNAEKQTFNASWNTNEPLDVTEVTAIIINGTRIPVK